MAGRAHNLARLAFAALVLLVAPARATALRLPGRTRPVVARRLRTAPRGSSAEAPTAVAPPRRADAAESAEAEAEALLALDWPRLSRHVGAFARTQSIRTLLLRGSGLPLPTSLEASRLLHAQTEAVLALRAKTGSWPALGGVADMRALSTLALKGGLLDEQELSAVQSTLATATLLAKSFKAAADDKADDDDRDPLGAERASADAAAIEPLWALFRGVPLCAELRSALIGAIDENSRVRDSASPQLAAARARAEGIRANIRKLLMAIAQGPKADALAERAPVLREGRYCLAVRASARGRVRGALIGESSTGSTYFIEPQEVSREAAELGDALRAERSALRAVLKALSAAVGARAPDLARLADALEAADLASARGRYADATSSEPVLLLDSATAPGLRIRQLRHPLLEFATEAGPIDAVRRRVEPPLGAQQLAAQAAAEARARAEVAAAAAAAAAAALDSFEDASAVVAEAAEDEDDAEEEEEGDWYEAADDEEGAEGAEDDEYGTVISADDDTADDDTADACDDDDDAVCVPAPAPASVGVVPVDFEIGQGVRCVVVTGPNTGGKTAGLKALGLAALMARAGLRLPARAESAVALDPGLARVRIPWFGRVLADVGDGQSLSASLSTFSAHVRRVRVMAAGCDRATLCLLDEAGMGTDPDEGAALAAATLVALASRSGLVLATTHHSSLKALKYERADFENAAVEFDEATLAPTYQWLWGVPGRSRALSIAARLGLGAEILADAASRLRGESLSVETVVAQLGVERKRLAAAVAEAEAEATAARAARARADADAAAAAAERLAAERTARATFEAELSTARAEIGLAVARLQAEGRPTDLRERSAVASAAAARVAALEGELSAGQAASLSARALASGGASARSHKEVGAAEAGDTLLHATLGEVVVQSTGKQGPTVLHGGLRVRAKWRDCLAVVRLAGSGGGVGGDASEWMPSPGSTPAAVAARLSGKLPGKARAAGAGGGGTRRPTAQVGANTVDVRGQYAEDAVSNVESALARATQYGALYVIHGHGTGRLRTAVREALSAHRFVERLDDAPDNQGGRGCTIAFLKD